MDGFGSMDISQVVTQITSIGFAVWYAWHTTTHTIPELAKRNDEITKIITDKHDLTVRKLVEDFRQDLREERIEFLNQLSAVNSTSDRMCDAIAELRQTISDVHGSRPK